MCYWETMESTTEVVLTIFKILKTCIPGLETHILSSSSSQEEFRPDQKNGRDLILISLSVNLLLAKQF